MDNQKLEKRKKINKVILIIFACLAIPLLIAIIFSPSDESEPQTVEVNKIEWQDATWEQKEQWLKAYLNRPDDEGYALIDEIDTQLRSKFNLPNSVDYNFNNRPTFVKAVIPDADSGLVVINGSGTAENGFGTEIPFTYNVQLEINPGVKRIKEINISQ